MKNRVPSEGTRVPVGRNEVPCISFLYGAKVQKSDAWEKVKQNKKI